MKLEYRYGFKTEGPSTENRKSNCKRLWPRPPCFPDVTGPPWWETSTLQHLERTKLTRTQIAWTDIIRRCHPVRICLQPWWANRLQSLVIIQIQLLLLISLLLRHLQEWCQKKSGTIKVYQHCGWTPDIIQISPHQCYNTKHRVAVIILDAYNIIIRLYANWIILNNYIILLAESFMFLKPCATFSCTIITSIE